VTDLGPGQARIIDRGYRTYKGERSGVPGAVRSVVVHSVQRALGLRRTLWAKLLPFASVLIAYLPAVVFVGTVALIDLDDVPDDFLPTYGDYYGFIIAAIMVFVALVAPEVLCTDRRSGMLGVYLSSPLDRDTYLVSKGLAIASVLSLVCLGPPLLMLVANVLQSQGPDGFADTVVTLLRVLGAGLALTLLYTGVTMGVASLTDRKTVAAAAIILLFLMSLTVTGVLTSTGSAFGIRGASPTLLSLDLASRIHGERSVIMRGTSSAVVWGAWFVWTAGGFALARFNLQRLPVTR
jgi:ABC-2 type transport system permease protein